MKLIGSYQNEVDRILPVPSYQPEVDRILPACRWRRYEVDRSLEPVDDCPRKTRTIQEHLDSPSATFGDFSAILTTDADIDTDDRHSKSSQLEEEEEANEGNNYNSYNNRHHNTRKSLQLEEEEPNKGTNYNSYDIKMASKKLSIKIISDLS